MAPSGGSGGHWYVVTFANSSTNFHPHVHLSAGRTEYVFDVFTDCNGSRPFGCGSSSTAEPFGTIDWETIGIPVACITPGQQIFVRVRPLTVNLQCLSYSVVFVNG